MLPHQRIINILWCVISSKEYGHADETGGYVVIHLWIIRTRVSSKRDNNM